MDESIQGGFGLQIIHKNEHYSVSPYQIVSNNVILVPHQLRRSKTIFFFAVRKQSINNHNLPGIFNT